VSSAAGSARTAAASAGDQRRARLRQAFTSRRMPELKTGREVTGFPPFLLSVASTYERLMGSGPQD
jgi:hypothetical protein